MNLRLPQSLVLLLAASFLTGTALRPAAGQAPKANPAAEAAPAPGNSVVEDILVRVNDQIISRSDYERAEQQMQAESRQRNIPAADVEAQKKNLLRDLIDQQLLLSKGKELGITGEAELVRQLDEIRKQNHLESMEDLEKAAKDQGVSYEDFKANIRNRIITQSVVRDEVGRRLQMSQGEERQFYQAHRAEFDEPESVRLSEILVSTGAPPATANAEAQPASDPAKVAAAKAKSGDLYAKLKAGADFAGLAKSSSEGPTAGQGGDLGTFRRGMLAKQLEEQTFALKAGEYTQPIQTRQGFVILKVMEHNAGGIPPFEDVQQEIEQAAYSEKMQPALRAYLTKLREESFVDIKPGYVDSGASAAQTKPVYSAYTPPAPKKKKKVERTRFRQKSRGGHPVQKASVAPPLPAAAGGPAQPPAAAAKTGVASAAPSTMKPGKKEKIRYGQAPRETLPAAPETERVDAGAAPPAAEVASTSVPENPLEPAAPVQAKKRYSDRLKLPKEKKPKGPQPDPFAPPPPGDEETATQKVQSAPLGLSGDTSKKPKKQKTGPKTRYSDAAKPQDGSAQPAPAAPADGAAPAPAPASKP